MNETTIVYNSQMSGYLAKCWSLTQAQVNTQKKNCVVLCRSSTYDLLITSLGLLVSKDALSLNSRRPVGVEEIELKV